MFLVSVACCQVVSATGRPLVQRSLTEYGCLNVMEETRRGVLGPLGLSSHEEK